MTKQPKPVLTGYVFREEFGSGPTMFTLKYTVMKDGGIRVIEGHEAVMYRTFVRKDRVSDTPALAIARFIDLQEGLIRWAEQKIIDHKRNIEIAQKALG